MLWPRGWRIAELVAGEANTHGQREREGYLADFLGHRSFSGCKDYTLNICVFVCVFFTVTERTSMIPITSIHSLRNSILLLPCLMVYYIVPVLLLLAFWCPGMTINVNIQYSRGLFPDIILLTQCYPILCLMGYYIASGFAFTTMVDGVLHCSCFVRTFWCPCMTINVSIQYNGGLPDIILLTECYPILLIICLMWYYIASVFAFSCVLLPDIILLTQCCVLLPDIILLTQCYCHRGTWVNDMERFRSCRLRNCSLLSHLIGFSLTRMPCSGFVFIVYVIVSYYYHA